MGALDFTKMHGLGNDFVILDGRERDLELGPDQCRHLANRRQGVGCDQILILTTATHSDCAFAYRVINADGSLAQQCGNGVRCLARWLHDQAAIDRQACLESPAGPVAVAVSAGGWVTVEMGRPEFDPGRVPFLAEGISERYLIDVAGRTLEAAVLSLGNPHAVIEVNELERAPVAQVGAALQSHPRFPEGVNVGFVEIIDRGHLRLRVFERGVGETPACGSGACAAAVAAARWYAGDERIEVSLRGGELFVEWPGGEAAVKMSGPASYAFSGRIDL